jgi:hypothetical protein
MSANKIDISTVCEMFEKLNDKLDKQTTSKQTKLIQIDLTTVNAMTERFEGVIREARKPVWVEHHHKIEIASNWCFSFIGGDGFNDTGHVIFYWQPTANH